MSCKKCHWKPYQCRKRFHFGQHFFTRFHRNNCKKWFVFPIYRFRSIYLTTVCYAYPFKNDVVLCELKHCHSMDEYFVCGQCIVHTMVFASWMCMYCSSCTSFISAKSQHLALTIQFAYTNISFSRTDQVLCENCQWIMNKFDHSAIVVRFAVSFNWNLVRNTDHVYYWWRVIIIDDHPQCIIIIVYNTHTHTWTYNRFSAKI